MVVWGVLLRWRVEALRLRGHIARRFLASAGMRAARPAFFADMTTRRTLFVAVVALLIALCAPPVRAADNETISDLAGCAGPDDPDCSVPPGAPPQPGGGGGGSTELPKLVAWTSAYDINPFNGGKGGIF